MPSMKRMDISITAVATTAAGTIGDIHGTIHKIEVLNDTASCGWWLYIDASDSDNGNIIDENVLGATGAGHVDTAGAVYYPVVAQVLTTGVATDPDTTSPVIVGGRLQYDVDDCAATEVLRIVVWYTPFSD